MKALLQSSIESLPLLGRGKVRDMYAVGEDKLPIAASDRISAFDVTLDVPIPGKGQVLTALTEVQPKADSDGGAGDEDWASLAVAFAAATVTGFATVRWLLAYIANHRFTPFAWYRIGLGAALPAVYSAG